VSAPRLHLRAGRARTRRTEHHLVSKAPLAEIKRYPYGHFDIYVGDPFEQVVADQVGFLQRHLLPQRSALTEAVGAS
jgi:hypothetical protein